MYFFCFKQSFLIINFFNEIYYDFIIIPTYITQNKMNIVVGDYFRLDRTLGSGSFG